MAEKNYAILGLGRYGQKIAETVAKTGVTILVADSDSEKIDNLGGRFTSAVSFDMTNTEALEDIGLENIDVAIIDLCDDLEGSITCVMVAKKCGVDRIIVTTDNRRTGEVLSRLGADDVVIPEEESALRMAKSLISEDFMDYTDLGDGLCVVKYQVKSEWNNKTIRKLNLRVKNGINIVAVKEENGDRLTVEFSAEQVLHTGDPIVLSMHKEALYQFV